MTRWKDTERQIAKLLHGERVPITGRARGSAPDISHDFFSIEVKDRQNLPEWIADAMNQADASNKNNKIPLVILHGKGMKHQDNYAILRLGDIIKMYEQIGGTMNRKGDPEDEHTEPDEHPWETDAEGDDSDGADEKEAEND